jgi:hypothetical protein
MSRRASVPNVVSAGEGSPPLSPERRVFSIRASDVGFHGDARPAASSRLSNAVAASIAVGTLSLCAGVALAVLSIKASMALPIPT